LFALLDGQDFAQVENGLLPVSVLGMGTGAESNWLVASSEVNVEPCDESVDEVVATAIEDKGRGECEVGGCAGVEIEGEDCGWVGDNSLDFDGIDERFGEGSVLEWGVIESVDIVPDLFC
jgi:hypothetical protein